MGKQIEGVMGTEETEADDQGAVDAEAAFDEGAGIEAAEQEPDGDPDPDPAEQQTDPEPDADPEPKHDSEPEPKNWEEEFKALEKRVHDNQAWSTRVAQENAELKLKLSQKAEALPKPKETPAEDIPEKIKAYYATDPDLKDVVAYEAAKLVKERFGDFDPRTVDQRLADTHARLEQGNFERAVLYGVPTPGGFVKGHPDALEVMNTTEYQQWFSVEAQRDASILSVSDPVQAIGIMDRYKTRVAEAAAQKQTEARTTVKTQVEDMMSGAVSKGNKAASERKKDDGDLSPEEAFEQGIK